MQRQQSGRPSEAGSQFNRVSEHMREGYDAATECITNYPASSMLVTFGVGFGVGMLIGHLLAEPPHEERSSMARLGRSVLDAMHRYMPDSIARHVGG